MKWLKKLKKCLIILCQSEGRKKCDKKAPNNKKKQRLLNKKSFWSLLNEIIKKFYNLCVDISHNTNKNKIFIAYTMKIMNKVTIIIK